jgi:hypothetical protein
MRYAYLMRTAVAAATLGAGCVLAQTAPVLTDVGPPPAEERNSTGAIVLEDSLVRAQRENAFQRSASRTGVATVGRGILRATMEAQREADLAQARGSRAPEVFDRSLRNHTPN